MSEFAVRTKGLTMRFGRTVAVSGLDLSVPRGALFGLIGPNGAGKTTTLRMLAGLIEPSAGTIWINGSLEVGSGRAQQDVRRQIGYMPDFFGVYEDMRSWEYLDFFARCYGIGPRRRARVVDELLELVDLGDKRDSDVHTLSRGMKQRLCLAHALVHDPAILLLDEPASGLDPRARMEIRELLRELSTMGKTILISSHILSELEQMCDQVAIMERGRLVASGPVEEIEGSAGARQSLRLKVTSDVDDAMALLEAIPEVSGVQRGAHGEGDEGWLTFEFDGDEGARSELLVRLMASGVRVSSLTVRQRDLEHLFMQLTKGDVA